MTKLEVHTALKMELEQRITALKAILMNSYIAVANEDTKSSAGDKHETAVSMAQLEQEKLTHQINQLLALQQQFQRIQTDTNHTKVQLGSLLLTDKGYFYVSIGLGKVEQGGKSFFALGMDAPLVRLLVGKQVGESVLFNGSTTEILTLN
jgi:transcription elongation GreA/GreB family factor